MNPVISQNKTDVLIPNVQAGSINKKSKQNSSKVKLNSNSNDASFTDRPVGANQKGINQNQDPEVLVDAAKVSQMNINSVKPTHSTSATEQPNPIPCPDIFFPSPEPDQSSYNAIATGLLALDKDKLANVLNKLGLKNLEGSIIKPNYFKGELLLFQRFLLDALKVFHKQNKITIDLIAKNIFSDSLPRRVNDADLKPFVDFSETFSGLMPIQLMIALGQELGISIGIEEANDIQIHEKNSQHIASFPNARVLNFSLNTPIDLSKFRESRLQQDLDLSEIIRDKDSLTLEALDILYKNMLNSPMAKVNTLPMFGVTQSGKTSLFNFLLDIDSDSIFSQRIGSGVTSATALHLSQLSDGIHYIDTPGLEENRSKILEVLINYQLIEILYSNELSNLVVTLRQSDLVNLSSNGIRSFMDFFGTFFDVFKLGLDEAGNGFYDRLHTKHFDDEFFRSFRDAITNKFKGGSSKDLIQSKWDKFLEEIESEVSKLDCVPFTFVIRNDFSELLGMPFTESDLQTLLEKAIKTTKEEMLSYIKKGDDIKKNMLRFYIYLLLIKRKSMPANLNEGNESLKAFVNSEKFDFDLIKIPLGNVNNTQGVKPLFEDFIKDKLIAFSSVLKQYRDANKNLPKELDELNKVRMQIAGLKPFVESGELPTNMRGQLDSIESKIKVLNTDITKLEGEIKKLEDKNKEMDSDATIDRPGWPQTKTADQGWLWRYINFDHEKHHKSDVVVDMKYDSSGNEKFTVVKDDTKHIVQFKWFFKDWFNDSDYSVTCHNYTIKKEFYKEKISKNNQDITSKQTELNSKKNLLHLERQLWQTTRADQLVVLNEELSTLESDLKKSYEKFHESISVNSKLFDRLKLMAPDMRLVYKMLNDEKLMFFKHVIQDVKSDEFLELIQQIDADN
ncbi:MAG: hypothetical protein VXX85_02420 [Candidatus Margulisiibacteriota bacterium]|nr:hypothetical protein [Candidatus Margulisiibacteriota bacterium]